MTREEALKSAVIYTLPGLGRPKAVRTPDWYAYWSRFAEEFRRGRKPITLAIIRNEFSRLAQYVETSNAPA